jgi:hypothetical protein
MILCHVAQDPRPRGARGAGGPAGAARPHPVRTIIIAPVYTENPCNVVVFFLTPIAQGPRGEAGEGGTGAAGHVEARGGEALQVARAAPGGRPRPRPRPRPAPRASRCGPARARRFATAPFALGGTLRAAPCCCLTLTLTVARCSAAWLLVCWPCPRGRRLVACWPCPRGRPGR